MWSAGRLLVLAQAHPEVPVVPVPVVHLLVVPVWYERPCCGLPVMPVCYDCPWCGLPIVPSVIVCGVWFSSLPVVLGVEVCGMWLRWLVRRADVVLCRCGRRMPVESD
jgi:hypothetical protein